MKDFHNTSEYPFIEALESNWGRIYEEYKGVVSKLEEWPEHELYNHEWDLFRLFQWPNGEELVNNTELCPFTSNLIRDLIPTHRAAGFSRIGPGTRIQPHTGYPGNFLRYHLGLSIPDGDCAIRVNKTTAKWATGRSLLFDDRVEHEVWNLTPYQRVILIVDFVP